MSPTILGVKILQLKYVHKNIGGTAASPTQINSVRIKIPPERVVGDYPVVYARAASSGSFEPVTGPVVSSQGALHSFATPGTEVHLRIGKSGGKITGRNSAGKITNAITCEVVS